MKKNNLVFVVMMAIAGTLIFQSCRRGPDDPFLSFRGRDARLAGSYKMTGLDGSSVSTTVSGTSTTINTTKTTYSNGVESQVYNGGSSTISGRYTATIEFKKDGTFSYTYETFDNTGKSNGKDEGNGNWVWANTGKKKTFILIDMYDAVGISKFSGLWEVDQLKNKEIKLKKESRNKSTNGGGTSSSETVSSSLFTYSAN